MPSLIKVMVRADGVVAHKHPTLGNPEGRWHWGWEKHQGDENAHERENVTEYQFIPSAKCSGTQLTAAFKRQYAQALAGKSFLAVIKAYRENERNVASGQPTEVARVKCPSPEEAERILAEAEF